MEPRGPFVKYHRTKIIHALGFKVLIYLHDCAVRTFHVHLQVTLALACLLEKEKKQPPFTVDVAVVDRL